MFFEPLETQGRREPELPQLPACTSHQPQGQEPAVILLIIPVIAMPSIVLRNLEKMLFTVSWLPQCPLLGTVRFPSNMV